MGPWGRGRFMLALIQGISPFDDRAGVAEWQTSSVPISVCAPSATMIGSAGGAAILTAIARSTIIDCHLMI
ncbi:MAG: hypothetical protein A2X58_12215 [Nitrospirae bacterium GWC2_56_14]|nr:MAG: hypothetical protein A2X58_12215 [Nitrospirae bacterium GWC2_56_14]